MENLYIETDNGNIPIKKEVIEKHKLEKGMISPFTRFRIVGENGEFPFRAAAKKDLKQDTMNADAEDVMLTASEIIDFSQGADSHTEEE